LNGAGPLGQNTHFLGLAGLQQLLNPRQTLDDVPCLGPLEHQEGQRIPPLHQIAIPYLQDGTRRNQVGPRHPQQDLAVRYLHHLS
jgi:hypothetical protein